MDGMIKRGILSKVLVGFSKMMEHTIRKKLNISDLTKKRKTKMRIKKTISQAMKKVKMMRKMKNMRKPSYPMKKNIFLIRIFNEFIIYVCFIR